MSLFPNILLLALIALPLAGLAKTSIPEILGTWHFEGPRSTNWGEPQRQMTLSFDERGQSDLVAWVREEDGVCRRTAHFWFDEGSETLVQTNIALDPFSPQSCEENEDMRIGNETKHKVRFQDDRMILTSERPDGSAAVSEWTFAFP